jgi:hypothetical protein
VIDGPKASEQPEARQSWAHRPSDIISHKWEGKTVINHATAAGCQPDEWLLVETWDES